MLNEREATGGKGVAERAGIVSDNDAMKALQRGFAVNCEQNPGMEVQQYGTVYRM
jgi:hypothetical protein